ncbi:hypothetical protein [Kangiella shandongensis]|uniref:hypothetical protein n=1 Tax=Kangiella shandongensis TaxID=2763258 RepID=UPI001CC08D90|nr:hypothetical protein [Kangiella shandongensis]
MKKIIILVSLLFIAGAKGFNSWEDIDQQDTTAIKHFYSGELKKAFVHIKARAEKGDPVAQYTLAHMYDFAAKRLGCGGYRNCRINFFKPIDGFELSNFKAI